MKTSKTIRISVCFFMIVAFSCGIHKNYNKTFTFIQITDPQFGFFSNNKGFMEETLLYEKAVSKINMVNPVFVVITGDLVNDKSNQVQWDEFRRITSMINPEIKVYLTPGNHDIGLNPEKKNIDYYKSMFGNDRFSFEFGNNRFIGFNSCLIKAGTSVPEQEQFEWLKKELAASPGTGRIFLFFKEEFRHQYFSLDSVRVVW